MSEKANIQDMKNTNNSIQPGLMKRAVAAEYLQRSTSTLARWACEGGGPKFIKIGKAKASGVYYRKEDLDAWLEANVVSSTSEVNER